MQYGGRPASLGTLVDDTERRQSGQLFTTLVQRTQVGTYISQGGVFRFVNPESLQQTGYDRHEIVGKPTMTIVFPEDQDLVRDRARDMLSGKRVLPYETRCRMKDGSARRFMSALAQVEYEGRPAVLGTLMDVTERRQNEQLFSTMAQRAPVGMFISQDGAVRFTNGRFLEQTGYESAEVLGRSISALAFPEDQELLRTMARSMLNSNGSAPIEILLRAKSGSGRWFMCTLAPVSYEGKPAVLGTLMDITDRKEAEQARVLRAQELEALMSATAILTLPLSFEEKINKLLEQLVKVVQAHNASLRVMDVDGSSMKFVAVVGSISPAPPELGPMTQPSQTVLRAFREARHIVVDDYAADPSATAMVRALGVRSVVVLPVMLEGRPIAVATVASANPGHFTEPRVRLVKAIADGMGALLNASKLADLEKQRASELEQRVTELTALNQLFRKHLSERYDMIDTYRTLVEQLQGLAQQTRSLADFAGTHPPTWPEGRQPDGPAPRPD